MAEKILIQSDNLQIEGLLDRRTTDKGAVISHPHPLYGGNMYAAGVESIVHAYWKKRIYHFKVQFQRSRQQPGALR